MDDYEIKPNGTPVWKTSKTDPALYTPDYYTEFFLKFPLCRRISTTMEMHTLHGSALDVAYQHWI